MPNKDLRQVILESISEQKLRDEMVIPLIKALGLHYYFTYDSRRSPEGFPDLVIWGRKIIFRELKTEKGRLTAKQEECLVSLTNVVDVTVWNPSAWNAGIIERELREL